MDTESLLRLLNAHKVRYVIMGMKRAAGRPKDLADLQALLKLQHLNGDQVEAPPESD